MGESGAVGRATRTHGEASRREAGSTRTLGRIPWTRMSPVSHALRTLACCVRSGGRASLARRRLVTYGWLRADVPEGAVSDGTCVCEMNRGIPCACRGVVDRSRWAEERLVVQSARGTARAASPPRSPPSVCIGCRTDVRP